MVVLMACVRRSGGLALTIVMFVVDRLNIVKGRGCFEFKRLFRRKKEL